MKKIKVYIAVSLDGYVAYPDGGIEWLSQFINPVLHDYGRKEFYDSVDTIIMGNGTYQEICSLDIDFPFRDKSTYVLSRRSDNRPRNVMFRTLLEMCLKAYEKSSNRTLKTSGF
jgi:dihydrofolate reductase